MPTPRKQRRHADIVAALLLIALGALVAWSSYSLPPPMLEPVGPAVFPRWTGLALMVLAALLLVGALRGLPAAQDAAAVVPVKAAPRNDLALATVVLTFAYVAAMELEWLGFRTATTGYVFIVMLLLTPTGQRLRQVPVATGTALLLGLGLHYLFTRFFYIDLPT